MYASTLLSCRTSGRPPKREGARPPLFSTHRSKPARLRPEGVSRSRAASHPAYRSPQRPSQHLVQRVALVLTRPQVGEIGTCSVDFSMSPPNMPYAMRVNITETRCNGPGESLLPRTAENTPSTHFGE
jgi:hypothetical protein